MFSRTFNLLSAWTLILTSVAVLLAGDIAGSGEPQARQANLTLSLRQAPVLLARLKYDGDWNNRPESFVNFCRWAEKIFETDLDWQTISIASSVDDWHDSQLLVICGSKAPNFSDREIAKLRTFVERGGTLFSITENGGAEFANAMAAIYRKLFPKYEIRTVGKDEAVRTSLYRLPENLKISVIGNGIRPLAIHTDEDLTNAWQTNDIITMKSSFKTAANILVMLTENQFNRRGANRWPKEQTGQVRSLKAARIRHAGNYDPEPLALERFSRRLAGECGLKLDLAQPSRSACPAGPMPTGLAPSELTSDIKIAFLTSTDNFRIPTHEKAAIRKWVDDGGLLVVDVAGGVRGLSDANSLSAMSARILINELWPCEALTPLPPSSPIFRAGGRLIDCVQYRDMTLDRMGVVIDPLLLALSDDDRVKVIFSAEDLSCGLAGYSNTRIDGYTSDSACRIVRNLCLYAMPRQDGSLSANSSGQDHIAASVENGGKGSAGNTVIADSVTGASGSEIRPGDKVNLSGLFPDGPDRQARILPIINSVQVISIAARGETDNRREITIRLDWKGPADQEKQLQNVLTHAIGGRIMIEPSDDRNASSSEIIAGLEQFSAGPSSENQSASRQADIRTMHPVNQAPSPSQAVAMDIKKQFTLLSNDNYKIREQAMKRLISIGKRVLPTAGNALYDKTLDPETIERLKVVMSNILPKSPWSDPVFSPAETTRSVAFVVDSSGSMTRNYGWVRKVLQASIDNFDPYMGFHITCFGLTPCSENGPKRLVPSLMQYKVSTSAFINGMTPEGPTNPAAAIKRAIEAINEAQRPGRREIFLITDGLFADGNAVLDTLAASNPPGENQIIIHAFLIGKRTKEGEDLLKKIASSNKGSYKHIDPYEDSD